MIRTADLAGRTQWHQLEKDDRNPGAISNAVFDYVTAVEKNQFDMFDRFEKLEGLYDPNSTTTVQSGMGTWLLGLVTENVVASNIDTVTAAIAATDVRPRFMTDDADWSTQRTARRLEWYAEGLSTLLDVSAKARQAFKEAAKKGTGLVKVYADGFGQVRVDMVRCDDIIVDEVQCRNGASPKQLHQRLTNVDREELAAQFPDFEDEIKQAQSGPGGSWRSWAGYRPLFGDNLVVIESWKLPIGTKGKKGYKPGRHLITIHNCVLLDEEYHKTFFPFARIVWSDRVNGWYGISLAERIAGIQRALNKRNWQIDRNLDQVAVPTTYVRAIDSNLTAKASRAGSVTVYKGDEPKTIFPIAVSAETYQNRNDMKSAAYEESGVSRLAAQSVKPSGLDSGVAMREYRDQTTQRFALQEKAFERLVLDIIWLAIDVCKDLGEQAPVIVRKAKFGSKKVTWKDVDMTDVRVQITAASTLSRTPAGRYQTALEWAQAGVITTDEWRRLTQHPDLDRVLSLYTQGIESVERDIEMIEDGDMAVPEPFGNLELMVRVGQVAYLRDRDLGAPEEILEGLRQYVELAADMVAKKTDAANQNAAAMAAASMPMGGPAMGPGAATGMPMPGGMDAGINTVQPVAALAPQSLAS